MDYFRVSGAVILLAVVGVSVAILVILSRWLSRDE
jgi:hypothetical protein